MDENGDPVDVLIEYTAEHLVWFLDDINLDDDGKVCTQTYDADNNQICTYPDGSYEKLDLSNLVYYEYDAEGYLVYKESIAEAFESFAVYVGATIYTYEGEEVQFKTDGTVEILDPKTGIVTTVDPYSMTKTKKDFTGEQTLSQEQLTFEMVSDFFYDLDIDYIDYNIDFENLCDQFPDLCVDQEVDLVALCDNLWIFPEDYFQDTGMDALCEVDFEEACGAFPDLCDSNTGTFSSDICGVYPDKCDENSADFSPCA